MSSIDAYKLIVKDLLDYSVPPSTKPNINPPEKHTNPPGEYHRTMLSVNLKHGEGYQADQSVENNTVINPADATLITSKIFASDQHAPVLDLDVKHVYVESSTPGHGHLYIDKPMSWEMFEKVLTVLAEAGIIQEGYAAASIKRKYSAVRPPWVRKTGDEPSCSTCCGTNVVSVEHQMGAPTTGGFVTCPDCQPTPSKAVEDFDTAF